MKNVTGLVVTLIASVIAASSGAKEPLCEGDQHQVDCLLQQRFQDCKTNPDFSQLARPLLNSELQSLCRNPKKPCFGLGSGMFADCIGAYQEFLRPHNDELVALAKQNECTDTQDYSADPARGKPVRGTADCACRVAAANGTRNGTPGSGKATTKCDLDLACPAAFDVSGQGVQPAGLYQASCRTKSSSCGDVPISECMTDTGAVGTGKSETEVPKKGSAK